jgi:hypothetical protein
LAKKKRPGCAVSPLSAEVSVRFGKPGSCHLFRHTMAMTRSATLFAMVSRNLIDQAGKLLAEVAGAESTGLTAPASSLW